MGHLRRLGFVVLIALALPVRAALLPNLSDQWWVPTESGWGAAILHQGSTLFIDIFVYDANGNPQWFISTAVLQGQLGAGDYLFSGDLIATTGAYYGSGAFSPNSVTRQKVGMLTLDVLTPTSAKLTYTVNGVTVNKMLIRQFLQGVDVSGSFFGGFVFSASGCTPSALDGPVSQLATLQIGKSGSAISIFAAGINGGSCNYTGSYQQDGHLGTIAGDFSCSNGDHGPFTLSEIEANRSGISGQFNAQSQACTKLQGQFGGVRTTLGP